MSTFFFFFFILLLFQTSTLRAPPVVQVLGKHVLMVKQLALSLITQNVPSLIKLMNCQAELEAILRLRGSF